MRAADGVTDDTRLASNSPAFAQGMPPKPVISFGKRDFNNIPGSNSLRHLTVRVGAGNPAAVGVKFGGANSSDITNVAIISEDPEGRGAVGLDDSIGTVLSYQRDLVIEGFDYGVQVTPYHFARPSLEHVTVRNQRIAGVHFIDGTASLRALRSENRVPALLLSAPGNHAVIVDSELVGSDPAAPAIQLDQGHLFARKVSVEGYGMGVRRGGNAVVPADIVEFVSDPVVRFDDMLASSSRALRVEEVPPSPWEHDLSQWTRPEQRGNGVGDASPAVQAALNAGTSTVYFPGYEYRFESTVTIPCSVRNLQMLFTTISGPASPKFRVEGPCPDPLTVQDGTTSGGIGFDHVGDRTLVLSRITTRAFLYRNSVAGGEATLFANMVTGIKARQPFHDQRVFLRVFNGESLEGQVLCDNADV